MQESLKEKTSRGIFWGGLSNGTQQLIGFVFGIFLARILDVDDYGMVGMITIFSNIASSIQDSGFTIALTNKKKADHKDYNAVFWFNIITGLILYFLLYLAAPYIASFYETPELTKLSRYVFLGFVISSFGVAQNAYLFRNLMVKQKAISMVIGLTISGILGITLAVWGMGYWSLATQSLVYVASISICYWFFSPWRPSFQISFKPLRQMVRFSIKLLITNIFIHINHNLFSVILGRFYSEKEVGDYTQANKWNSMGHSFVSEMVHSVAQPVLAQVQNDIERQRNIFRKMLRFTAFISFPALFGLSLISKELIVIGITDKWMGAITILQLLCIGGAFTPVTRLYTNMILTKGKSNIYMWNTILICIFQILAVTISYRWGIQTMIIIYISINILWLFIWHYFVWKEIKLSLRNMLKDILPYLLISVAVMLITYIITFPIENLYIALISKIIIAVALYSTIMWLSKSVIFKESINFLFKKK